MKHDVVYQRRKVRQAKMQGGPYPYANPSAMESASFNPRESESDLPLNPGESSQYQQWDNRGNAVGYAGDPRNPIHVVAPRPQRPVIADSLTNPVASNMYGTQQPQFALPPGAAPTHMLPGQVHQPQPAPQFQAPSSPYAQVRQDSVESVSWDTSTQGAYRLPSIARHQSPVMTFNSYPPPPGPPPQQQQEQLRHPPVSDPFFASSTEFGGSAGGDVAAPPALPPPTQYAQYLPPSLTNPYAGRNQSYEPGSSSPSTPRARDSGMFTSAVQRTASPGSAPGRLPSPKFESFGQAIADSTGAVGGHETEPSVYYTPPHSRVASEDTAGAVPLAQPERTLSPPPPSYRV